MRSFTMQTTRWEDEYVTTDIYNKRGDWVSNVGGFLQTDGDLRQLLSPQLERDDFTNIRWEHGEPVSATRDEYKLERSIFPGSGDGEESPYPAVDEDTDWVLFRTPEHIPDSDPAPEMVERSARRVELEAMLNHALPADRHIWFHRCEADGLISGWGSVPVQIHGLIGPDAATAQATTAVTQAFYFRLRGNTARLDVFHDRNIPRHRVTHLPNDVAKVSTVYPVVDGDDYLGDLPGTPADTVDLFARLVKELEVPDPFENPTGAQSMTSYLVSAEISRALAEGGVVAADSAARARLSHPYASPYARRWLDLSDAEKDESCQKVAGEE